MTLSIWRYCHYLLAAIAGLFISVASLTGIILSFEPISEKYKGYRIEENENLTLAESISSLQDSHEDIFSIKVDENNVVIANLTTKNGKSGDFYINPNSAEILGEPKPKAQIFEFATNLHRSLFLKSTGRVIIGITSFLLFLIAISGFVLVTKRQGGIKKWFSKVVYEKASTYYHVVLSRWTFIPILIITTSSIVLSLDRFSILSQDKLKHDLAESHNLQENISIENFEVFNQLSIYDISSLEFPFSPFEEDYFILKTPTEEVYINQFNGDILSKAEVSVLSQLVDWSLVVHTGQGSVLWSIVLGLSCVLIIILMFSGYIIAYDRIKKSSKFTNRYSADQAEHIILVGSESGSTYAFAHRFARAMIKAKQSVFVEALDDFSHHKNAKHTVVFTATYGEGNAPANANHFKESLQNLNLEKKLKYAVVGFGSKAYPDYCQFAIEVNEQLKQHKNFDQVLPLFKINNGSEEAFKNWIQKWNNLQPYNLSLKSEHKKVKKLKRFEVTEISEVNIDDTYLIKLKPYSKSNFVSGDLLSLFPNEDLVERQYSIAKIGDEILLSIKKHEYGICSNFLFIQKPGNLIRAKLKLNNPFHLPNNSKEVIMISNGTGIAPFLGMISTHQFIKKHLFWGGRFERSLSLYQPYISSAIKNSTLTTFKIALSRSQDQRKYVQDLVPEHLSLFQNLILNGGIIMICGSITMQNLVLQKIEGLILPKTNKTLSDLQDLGQIKMDCY